MFNKLIIMQKNGVIFLIFIILISCAVEAKLIFKEYSLSKTEHAIIDINYPRAEGLEPTANVINTTIETYIAEQINMSEDSLTSLSIDAVVKQFDHEYIVFKEEFPESVQKWEALIDSEVTYESIELICVAVNSYLDTGGAHGNSYIEFLNFNPENGSTLELTDLINNIKEFTSLVEQFYLDETEEVTNSEGFGDSFFGKGFQLPESIGFSDEGIIILYNTYELASYSQGITEFTIPYEEASSFLKFGLSF